MPETTDNTATGNVNTDNSEQTNSAENNNQDSVAKLNEYEKRLTDLSKIEQEKQDLEKTLKTAQAEALRWQSSYKSLQSNTTASLQEAARVKRQLDEQQRIHDELSQARSEMAQVRTGLEFLASKMVDEDSAKEFQLRQRATQLQQMEESLKQRAQSLQATQSQPQQNYGYVDQEDQKRQFLDYYFPNSGIDHNNPDIDWGEGATDTREAFRRFTTSVMSIRGKVEVQNKENPQSEAQRLMEEIRQERQRLEDAKANLAEDVKAQARREVEERLRKTGADAGNITSSAESAKKISTRLNELDESKLNSTDPVARKKAAQDMQAELRSIRDQLLGQ